MGKHDWAHGEAEIRKVGLGLWRSKGGVREAVLDT